MNAQKPSCWIVYDEGKVGTGNQCIGLAQSLGYDPVIKTVTARSIWRLLPPRFWIKPLSGTVDEANNTLSPPWPDIIIAAGRASVAPTAYIRKHGGAFVIQLQDPCVDPRQFDLVIAPAHDQTTGNNVVITQGALHVLTREKLANAAEKFKKQFAQLPRPFVAVLIGGNNRKFSLTPAIITQMCNDLKLLMQKHGVGLAVTPSRRTGAKNIKLFQEQLAETAAFVWDGRGENPYMGLLALADYIIVTCDSVSMTSEACFTGKPVYTYQLPGKSRRSELFHSLFQKQGYTRPFTGDLEKWQYPPLDEFDKVIKAVRNRLAKRI